MHYPRLRVIIGLALATQLTGCSHYVTSEIEIRKSIHAVDLPEPEIVEADELEAARESIRSVAVYLIGDDVRDDELRELERSFVREGLHVIEARQIPGDSRHGADGLATRTDADITVIVYRLETVDVTRAEITAQPVFLYGSKPEKQVQMTPDQIEKKARATGSMQTVVDDAKALIERDDLMSVAQASAVLLDAKVISGESQQALLFYRAYTFTNPGALDLGTDQNRIRVGTYKYDEGKFRPHQKKRSMKDPENSYGDLTTSRNIDGPEMQLKNERLQQVEQACNDLVEVLKTPAALRY